MPKKNNNLFWGLHDSLDKLELFLSSFQGVKGFTVSLILHAI